MHDIILIYIWIGAFIQFFSIIFLSNAFDKSIRKKGLLKVIFFMLLDIFAWPYLIWLLILEFHKGGGTKMNKELYGKKLYVVVRHTYPYGYGDYVDLVGVYDDKDEAEGKAAGFNDESCDIHEVGLGFTYPTPMPSECPEDKSVYDKVVSLGGYAE